MKKSIYQYKKGKNEYNHIFINGIYAGFGENSAEPNGEYSLMVKNWIEKKFTEEELKEKLNDAGFIKLKTHIGGI